MILILYWWEVIMCPLFFFVLYLPAFRLWRALFYLVGTMLFPPVVLVGIWKMLVTPDKPYWVKKGGVDDGKWKQ